LAQSGRPLQATALELPLNTTGPAARSPLLKSGSEPRWRHSARSSDFVVVATARRSFTFFEAFSINFAIVVYFECMHVEMTCVNPTLGITEGNMAKKAKKAKKTAKKKKK
jgi:hypothetical protein